MNHRGVFGQFFLFSKFVHNFCRTLFQTPSGLAAQSHQSAGRRPFTDEPLPVICALTSGQTAEERHGQTGCRRCQVAFGQSKLMFCWNKAFALTVRSTITRAFEFNRAQSSHRLTSCGCGFSVIFPFNFHKRTIVKAFKSTAQYRASQLKEVTSERGLGRQWVSLKHHREVLHDPPVGKDLGNVIKSVQYALPRSLHVVGCRRRKIRVGKTILGIYVLHRIFPYTLSRRFFVLELYLKARESRCQVVSKYAESQ